MCQLAFQLIYVWANEQLHIKTGHDAAHHVSIKVKIDVSVRVEYNLYISSAIKNITISLHCVHLNTHIQTID